MMTPKLGVHETGSSSTSLPAAAMFDAQSLHISYVPERFKHPAVHVR
jgi:hypothetical protein